MDNLLLISNKKSTRIFRAKKNQIELSPIKQILNDKAGLKEADLISDRPGVSQNSQKGSKDSVTLKSRNSPVKHALKSYLKEVSSYLRSEELLGQYNGLILVAEPGLLGMLKKEIQRKKLKIINTIGKEITQVADKELGVLLQDEIKDSFF